MVGPLIYGFSEDAVAAAKVVSDFAKGNDKLVVKGGAYAGKVLDANGVKALAAIPSREVLISQIAGLLKSPVQRFAAVLAALAEKRGAGARSRSPCSGSACGGSRTGRRLIRRMTHDAQHIFKLNFL